jgi:hypothetical protein
MRAYLAAPWIDGDVAGTLARYAAQYRVWIGLPHIDEAAAGRRAPGWPLANVWLGVSVEDQRAAGERIAVLLDTPAAIRFVSAEPLLGPVDLTRICLLRKMPGSARAGIHINVLTGRYNESQLAYTGAWDINGPCPPDSDRRHLDWIICGGESGPGARPMWPDWARSLRDQCAAAGVPFFFKQWGAWAPEPEGGDATYEAHRRRGARDFVMLPPDLTGMELVGKSRAGRTLDGAVHDGFPGAGSAP